MKLLTTDEKKYINETVSYKGNPIIHMENLNGNNKLVFQSNLGSKPIPISHYAPLSFQAIILFTALDILNSRFNVNKLGEDFHSKKFSEIENALPSSNDTECIYKFCYSIMRSLRNKYIHQFPDEQTIHDISTNEFKITEKGINFLFNLITLYIDLYNGEELNKYDLEILKYYIHVIYKEINFLSNSFQNSVDCLFKNEKLNCDKSIKTIEYRHRYIIKINNIQELTNIKRQKNTIPLPEENKVMDMTNFDEYLIITQNKKYLVIGEYLEQSVQNLDELSKWELRGNWIGKKDYQQCYESSN